MTFRVMQDGEEWAQADTLKRAEVAALGLGLATVRSNGNRVLIILRPGVTIEKVSL